MDINTLVFSRTSGNVYLPMRAAEMEIIACRDAKMGTDAFPVRTDLTSKLTS